MLTFLQLGWIFNYALQVINGLIIICDEIYQHSLCSFMVKSHDNSKKKKRNDEEISNMLVIAGPARPSPSTTLRITCLCNFSERFY